jgi:hypothetical protein
LMIYASALNITEEDAMAIIGYLQRKNDQK